MTKNKLGFTLIELLVVVLIIGVLAAIALPMYQKAVLKSRFAALMPIVKSMNDSNEAYYLEHGQYASAPQDLPVQGQTEYPTGTELEFGSDMTYAYVLAHNQNARNNYIMYQKQSENYPGEIHCEAVTGDELSESVCISAGGTQNIGTTLTKGYTTYIIEGNGTGWPLWAKNANCSKAEELGIDCSVVEDSKGDAAKRMCIGQVCRTLYYNDDGSYVSYTCKTNQDKVCISDLAIANYNANGQMVRQLYCSHIETDGSCTAYASSGMYNTYDENGNQIRQRNCQTVAADGSCSAYQNSGSDYTYDAQGNRTSYRWCNAVDSTGTCTSYSYGYDYAYDANGNQISQRNCKTVASDGSCSAYDSSNNYDYTYDANGNQTRQRKCQTLASDGSCSSYYCAANGCFDYTYDANGNQTSQRNCSYVTSNGSCSSYANWNNYDYTYDANGNKTSQRYCKTLASNGSCKVYDTSNNYDYVYEGNRYSTRDCKTVAADGTCTEYKGTTYVYEYDDATKAMTYQYCSGDKLNTATGECYSYNWINVMGV